MYLSKKNQGIYEPEQRLWMALPASFTIPIGLFISGIGLANVSQLTPIVSHLLIIPGRSLDRHCSRLCYIRLWFCHLPRYCFGLLHRLLSRCGR